MIVPSASLLLAQCKSLIKTPFPGKLVLARTLTIFRHVRRNQKLSLPHTSSVRLVDGRRHMIRSL